MEPILDFFTQMRCLPVWAWIILGLFAWKLLFSRPLVIKK